MGAIEELIITCPELFTIDIAETFFASFNLRSPRQWAKRFIVAMFLMVVKTLRMAVFLFLVPRVGRGVLCACCARSILFSLIIFVACFVSNKQFAWVCARIP